MKTLKLLSLFLIAVLISCTEENYYNCDNQNLGKETIYIEGNLTNAEAQAQLANELGSATQNIYVQNTTQLTAINIHSTTNIRHIEFQNNKDLVTINISGFKKISELWFKSNTTFPSPTTPRNINCNDIEEALNLDITLPYSTPGHNVSFNKLKKVGPNDFTLLAECNELNFPLLETVNTFNFAVKKNSITFPSLKHMEYFYGPSYVEFSDINFPALEYCKEFYISPHGDNQQFINITIPQLQYCEEIRLNYCINNATVINYVLHQFLTVQPPSEKRIILVGTQTPPTGQGLIDKQTLIDNGNYVTTDN